MTDSGLGREMRAPRGNRGDGMEENGEVLCARWGEGRYEILGTAVHCGKDVALIFAGGSCPHVGAVSVGMYEPLRRSATVSTITVFTHRDDCLAVKCAKGASARLHCQAAVTVGIHIDKASQEELRILEENFWACSEELIDRLKQEREGWERENE